MRTRGFLQYRTVDAHEVIIYLPKKDEFLINLNEADKTLHWRAGSFMYRQKDKDGILKNMLTLHGVTDKYEILGALAEQIGSEEAQKLHLAVEYLLKAAKGNI